MEPITSDKLQGSIQYWWTYLLLGLFFIGVGIWLFFDPVEQLSSFHRLLAVFVILSGFYQVVIGAWRHDTEERWWWKMIIGGLEFFLGLAALFFPGFSSVLLGAVVAGWMLLRGAFLITFAFRLRKLEAQPWFWLLAGGILTILLSAFVFFNPSESLSIFFWIALNLLVTGLFHVLLSFDLRSLKA